MEKVNAGITKPLAELNLFFKKIFSRRPLIEG